MVLRFFERLDTLEKEMQELKKEQEHVTALLLAYVEADLEKPWEPAAKALAEKLRKIIKK